MKILLCGQRRVGKSTLIQRLIHKCGLQPAGFITQKQRLPAAEGESVHIHPAQRPTEPPTPANQVGCCRADGTFAAFPATFEQRGRELLADPAAGQWLLMDELGFMESQAPRFQQRVLELLQSPWPVLGAIKPQDTPFLAQVKATPGVDVIPLTAANREDVLAQLLPRCTPAPLCAALNLPWQPPATFALIGGGGKTTLLYALGHELAALGHKVVVTTTTHFMTPTPQQAPVCLTSNDPDELAIAMQQHNLVALGTKENKNGKLAAPAPILWPALPRLADFILVEADGSKRLPCKAHAPFEPVLPPHTDYVVGLVGWSAVGRPLAQACHRPELAGPLLGLSWEQPLQVEHIAQLITHPQGYQREITDSSRFRVVINQVDTAAQIESASQLALLLRQQNVPLVAVAALKASQPIKRVYEPL